MKAPIAAVLTCRTLRHCEIVNPVRPSFAAGDFRSNTCDDRFGGWRPRQPRHWTRRVLHQPLTACRA